MPYKINIGDKGKAWKLETESNYLNEKSLGDKIHGNELKPDLEEYEFEITGGSDIAGFPLYKELEGIGLKKFLFKKGWGMHDNRKGIKLRKTVRGRTISNKVVQINLKVLKHGKKHLEAIFPDQNAPKVKETKAEKEIIEKAPEKPIEVAA